MAVRVSIDIPAPRQAVWDEVAIIERHVEWMVDAERIDFLTDEHTGRGTEIAVVTRVGPFRTTDHMTFTEWQPPATMAVEHRGLFTGFGRFSLESLGPRLTRFSWEEVIRFPWYLGGPLAAFVAQPILRRIWRHNLERLAGRFSAR
jgi:carbon monoxide dehydrogenase subunit G